MATATQPHIGVEYVESVEFSATDFTPAQQAVLDALAAGASRIDAAKAANIHRSTVNNWERSIPSYREAICAAQAEYRASLISQLRRVSGKALDKLESLLDDPATPPSGHILRHPRIHSGLIELTLWTRDEGIKNGRVTKKSRDERRVARKADWGDPWF